MGTLFTKDIENSKHEGDKKGRLPDRECYAKGDETIQTSVRMKEIYKNILYCINSKKIYLDANVNLHNFSLLLCTNTTYLSKTINTFFKCNLKTLLNKCRVEHAKELLKKEECDLKTLPKRCGFASRSTFYAAFMKYEHTTPMDFRSHFMAIEIRKKIDLQIGNLLTI